MRICASVAAAIGLTLATASCSKVWNNPYADTAKTADQGQPSRLYAAFTARPKHLDPALSYTSDEAEFTYPIYEPPLQYHYLKRPYQLIPATLIQMPTVSYYDEQDRLISTDAPMAQWQHRVKKTVYRLRFQDNIRYAPHPCFAKRADGRLMYGDLSPGQAEHYERWSDFRETGTRSLTAHDYAYQIKRLASPRNTSPIFGHMSEYIVGLKTFAEELRQADQSLKGGASLPGKTPPWLDLRKFDLPGVKVMSDTVLDIHVHGLYPQFIYWLAMPFFAPVPWEADSFFHQPGFAHKNLSLDVWPVGTGPYQLVENDPNRRMVLKRNPNFRGEPYPSEGEPGDQAAGLLQDAGKQMPFIDEVVFTREKESIPYWNKFLQGYYDSSGVSSDTFDQVVRANAEGSSPLTDAMQAKGIRLQTSLATSIYYLGFNWLDPVVGGANATTPDALFKRRRLRQAIAIALDWEEFSQIFTNGRAMPAHGPLAPGLFGYEQTGVPNGHVNRYVYDVIDGKPKRKSLAVAKQLLAQAGYPDGRDAKTGAPLVLALDTTGSGPGDKARFDWYRKQFAKLNIQLDIRDTDWNRFQDKVRKGNTQLFFLGWNADYPDPENFLFLLYGANARAKNGGENAANYVNSEYDRLFERMKSMPNNAEREAIIRRMVRLVQEDAPWLFAFHPQQYVLNHGWLANIKPNDMARNDLKYHRVDDAARSLAQQAWNPPIRWPLVLLCLALVLMAIPLVLTWRQRQRQRALTIHAEVQ